MKKITIILFTAIAFLFVQQAAAQSLKEIMRQKKEEMAAKAKWKADQKVSEGMDKAIDAPEEAIKKSKEKKKNGKTKTKEKTEESGTATEATEATEAPASTGAGLSSKGTQTVIQTNIACESGRKKVEVLLKKHEGVFDAKINKDNGEVAVDYSSDGTSYNDLLKLITDAGFEADGSKPAKAGNPCKN